MWISLSMNICNIIMIMYSINLYLIVLRSIKSIGRYNVFVIPLLSLLIAKLIYRITISKGGIFV